MSAWQADEYRIDPDTGLPFAERATSDDDGFTVDLIAPMHEDLGDEVLLKDPGAFWRAAWGATDVDEDGN